jgi:hypothetical protein
VNWERKVMFVEVRVVFLKQIADEIQSKGLDLFVGRIIDAVFCSKSMSAVVG